MKIRHFRKFVSFSVLLSLFLFNFIPLVIVSSYKPWGKETYNGSEIQVYWESKVQEKDYRIPQDLDVLETDEFKIWIRSIYFPMRADNVTIQLFDYHIVEITYFDPTINATRTKQDRVYDIFKDEITLEIESGDSPYEWSDSRFGIISVNRETFPSFKNVNRTERVRVIFNEVEIEFDHWTNIAEVEITKTYGQFNTEHTFWLGIGIFILLVFIFIAGLIHRRAGVSPPPPSWYFWPMFLSFGVGLILLAFLLMGLPIESFTRFMSILPPVWIAFLVGIWLDFELPKRFSGKVEPYVFLEVDGDGTKTLVSIWALWGYFRGNKLEFIKNKNSYWEFGKRLLKGGCPAPDWIFKPKVPLTSKNKELPHVFGVTSFVQTPSSFKRDFKWYNVLISVVILPLIAIFPLLSGVANFSTGIAGLFILFIAVCYFVFTSIQLTSPSLEANQILHPSELTVLTNIHAISAMKVFVNETLQKHIEFVKDSEKTFFSRLKESIKRYRDAFTGKMKPLVIKEDFVKEKDERMKQLLDVIEWSKSKGLLEKLDDKNLNKS